MNTALVAPSLGTRLYRSLLNGAVLAHDDTIPCEVCEEDGCPHCGFVGRIEGFGLGKTPNDYRVRRVEPIGDRS